MLFFSFFLPVLVFLIKGGVGRWLGRNGLAFVGGSLFFFSLCILVVFGFLSIGLTTGIYMLDFWWIGRGVGWGLVFDRIGIEMVGLILTITLCVYIYSTEYMAHDPYLLRFLSYLSLFGFFMLTLVTASNLIQLFIGWEGVGIVSFLLINFWWMRLEANRAAIKAVIFNRVGDSFFLIAVVGVFLLFGLPEFESIALLDQNNPTLLLSFGDVRTWIGLGIFFAAVGKSAQLGLHAWLPDAMEGPTPVSSLLHSATMVTAGVFLLVRFLPLIMQSFSLVVILLFGGLTALLNAIWGFFQWDLKKIIAFSTCSQLGLMVVAVVLDAKLGFFHLVNHGFFKALLFLSAGSVIHGVSNEQDIRRMGGLFSFLPCTVVCLFTGSLALTGFPFLSGFYSKERILFGLAGVDSWVLVVLFVMLMLTSVFTILYSVKILVSVFFSTTTSVSSVRLLNNVHESPLRMLIPMCVLTVLTIFFGWFGEAWFVGPCLLNFDFMPLEVIYPSYKLLLVWFIFFLLFDWRAVLWVFINRWVGGWRIILFSFWVFSNRLGFISFYRLLAGAVLWFAYWISFLFLDRGVWERLGSAGVLLVSSKVRSFFAVRQWVVFADYLFEFALVTVLFCLTTTFGFGMLTVLGLSLFIFI